MGRRHTNHVFIFRRWLYRIYNVCKSYHLLTAVAPYYFIDRVGSRLIASAALLCQLLPSGERDRPRLFWLATFCLKMEAYRLVRVASVIHWLLLPPFVNCCRGHLFFLFYLSPWCRSQNYCYHHGMFFLNAHAAFGLWVEQSLQMINPKVSLPQWDFLQDSARYGTKWASYYYT